MKLLPIDFENRLNTKIIGHPFYTYSELDSTQITAKYLAESGAKEGTTVFAYSQKKGVGKNGRRWFSPLGGIWFTIILRPPFFSEKANMLNISFTTSCAEVLYSFKTIQPMIKWPNDILINGKKICGILTQMKSKPHWNMNNHKNESDIEYALVGVGRNLDTEMENFPPELENKITSLKEEIGEEIKLDDFFIFLLEKIDEYYLMLKKGEFSKIQERWEEFSLPFGLLVKTSTPKNIYEGQLVGTNENGHLIIRTPHGSLEEVVEGEIEIIG